MVCAQQRSSVRALAQWAPIEAQSCRAVALAGTALTALVVTLVTAAVEAGSRDHGGGNQGFSKEGGYEVIN